MIRSFPNTWEHMKVNMAHNEKFKTFNDIAHLLELEVENLEAAKLFYCVYIVESSLHKALDFKHKKGYKNI